MNKKTDKELEKLMQEEEHFNQKLEKIREKKKKLVEKSYQEITDYLVDLGIHNIDKKYILGSILYAKVAFDENDKVKLDELEKLSSSLLRSKKRSNTVETTNNSKKDISDKKKNTEQANQNIEEN